MSEDVQVSTIASAEQAVGALTSSANSLVAEVTSAMQLLDQAVAEIMRLRVENRSLRSEIAYLKASRAADVYIAERGEP